VCTLSWTTTRSGYELFFNRDERTSRGPEQPPCESRSTNVRFLAPRDGDAGGTWITLNELGVTNCLLNGYSESRGERTGPGRSRGLLVLDLAGLASSERVLEHLEASDLSPFEPFVLCTFQPDSERSLVARTIEWDGLVLASRRLSGDDAPICSSGHDAEAARRRRRAEWDRMRALAPMTPERLAEFHRSHLDSPGPESPCMHRADAQTRSMTRVQVASDRVRMSHAPGAPCTTSLGEPLMLDRRHASAPLR